MGQTHAEHHLTGDWALHPWKDCHDSQSLQRQKTCLEELRETWPFVGAASNGVRYWLLGVQRPLFFLPMQFILTGTLSGVMIYTVSRLCVCVCFNKLCRGINSWQNLCSACIALLPHRPGCYCLLFFFISCSSPHISLSFTDKHVDGERCWEGDLQRFKQVMELGVLVTCLCFSAAKLQQTELTTRMWWVVWIWLCVMSQCRCLADVITNTFCFCRLTVGFTATWTWWKLFIILFNAVCSQSSLWYYI